MRAILDTNVIVSAVLVAGSPPDSALRSAFQGSFELVTSPPLLAELSRVLQRPAMLSRLGWNAANVSDFVRAIEAEAIVVVPDREINLLTDYDDNRLLEAAVAADADYIVTGDRALLDLGAYEGTEIVAPARFVAILTGS